MMGVEWLDVLFLECLKVVSIEPSIFVVLFEGIVEKLGGLPYFLVGELQH